MIAGRLIEDYLLKTGQPRDDQLDGSFMYQRQLLRTLLTRLEVIMDDEQVPREVAVRILRHMIYGSPDPAEAEQRIRLEAEIKKLLLGTTKIPFNIPTSI